MSVCPDLSDEDIARLGDAGIRLYRSLVETMATGLSVLPDKPEETVAGTLRTLWHLAADLPLSVQAAAGRSLPPLDGAAAAALRGLVERRLTGEPLAYITGRQHFLGLEMLAGPGALIPRQETELLAGAAIRLLGDQLAERRQACAVDLCTGSGNVALALVHAHPEASVYASDLSAQAVELARRNAQFLGLADRVELRTGDLLEPFESNEFLASVDLLTCNPPYISTRKFETIADEIAKHEPRLAFDGGPLGVRILQRLIREAPRFLRRGGWLAFEVGLGQGQAVRRRLETSGSYLGVSEVVDANGEIRVLMAMV